MNQRDLPNFIQAQSPRGLRLLMLKTNIKHGITIRFFDIQFANGKWFAWFYIRPDDNELFNGDA